MNWTKEEVDKADTVFYGTDGTLVERWQAVFAWFVSTLAARGTHPAQVIEADLDVAEREWTDRERRAAARYRLTAELAQRAARIAGLEEKIAEMEGGALLDRNAIRLQRERAEAAEARVRQLAIAGQELSAAVDRHVGAPLTETELVCNALGGDPACVHPGDLNPGCNCGNPDCPGCCPS